MRLQCAFCLTNVCAVQNATHKSQNDGDNQTRHTGANAHTKAHLILRVCVSSISISQANWQLPQCNWKSARFPLTRHQSERRAEKVDNKNDYNSNITRINNSAACWTNTYNLWTYCSCFCCGVCHTMHSPLNGKLHTITKSNENWFITHAIYTVMHST